MHVLIAVVGVAGAGVIGRYSYRHLAPHGSTIRVLYDSCSQCTSTSGGGHVVCRCGVNSPHIDTYDVLGFYCWRAAHRTASRDARR